MVCRRAARPQALPGAGHHLRRQDSRAQCTRSFVFSNWCHRASLSRSCRCANSWTRSLVAIEQVRPSNQCDVLFFVPSL